MSEAPTGIEPHRRSLENAFQNLAEQAKRHTAFRSRALDLKSRRTGLARIYQMFDKDRSTGHITSRAEEWFLDNRHVIEDALAALKDDMPAGFVRSLPAISVDSARSRPMVAELAVLMIDHGGQPIESAWIEQAVNRFQRYRTLTIGELWALPSFLSQAVIDRLIAAGLRLVTLQPGNDRGEHDELADQVAGAVLSLRALTAHDWRESFEHLSRVEQILLTDPSGAYGGMDFLTRDRYRRRVEQLARRSPCTEADIAECVIGLCRASSPGKARHRHVGYWLIGGGHDHLRNELGYRPGVAQGFQDVLLRFPGPAFVALLILFSALTLGVLCAFTREHLHGLALLVTFILALIPVTGLSVALANGLITWILPPRPLARMNFEEHGIPAEFRTAVVVPVIFARPEDVDPVFERLEVNYLANVDPSLVFVLLGDLHDADKSDTDSDPRILERARSCINRLANVHGESHFMFLSRQRQWNPAEGCWMGWERKRGKLMEFNRLLAGAHDTSFSVRFGPAHLLDNVRYVLTLDADTRLPPGSARQLVGTLAHPLSHAVLDHRNHTLKAGYSIIQPRLEVDPDTTSATPFTRIFSGDTTLDLYTHASSEVYHDLFGEGVFTGKGIYDWRAIEHALGGRIPENTILSHDLLEGIHCRVGLASDIVLMEQFPSNVVSYMRRQHRWVRGDWQLLPWLKPKVRLADGRRQSNPLKWIHRWKIVDNLRRSLQPPAVLILMLVAMSGILPGNDGLWLLLFALLLGAGLLTEILDTLGRSLFSPHSARPRLARLPGNLLQQFRFWLLNLVLLPYQSHMLVDATVRALVRMGLTHKNLLEWTTAAHVQRSVGSARRRLWREMWAAPALAIITSAVLVFHDPLMLALASPLLLGWLLAPQITSWVDHRRTVKDSPPDPAALALLRQVGRRTWMYFDQLVGPETHWLPPDNYQQDPRVVLAERTSPTNMGLALDSALAAHDMGWVDCLSLAAWLRNAMEGMDRLERYRGHWLNWYELRNLNRLEPAYVSTVDSGNLAVSLVTLARGLEELLTTPLDPAGLLQGLADTLGVIAETIEALPGVVPIHQRSRHLLARIHQLRDELLLADLPACRPLLKHWQDEYLDEIAEDVTGLAEDEHIAVSFEAIAEFRIWLKQLGDQLARMQNVLDQLLPWLDELETLHTLATGSDEQAADWRRLASLLTGPWKLRTWSGRSRRALTLVGRLRTLTRRTELLDRLIGQLEQSDAAACRLRADFVAIIDHADRWANEMDFRFLYDEERHLFRIGFDVSNAVPDPNYYDLLASEARLASLFAIATGQAPTRHWLQLGRPFRRRRGRTILMSWSATLFEYMMPRLFTRTPERTLLERASRSAIFMHRQFADRFHVPWGISESAYYQLDEQQIYAYRAFGVPGLGFKRDLGERLVIAPYASLMALPFEPKAVVDNLRLIQSLRGIGLYGCYEALDYGRSISRSVRRAKIVKAWMSHHQSMSLLAIDNYFNDDAMVRRFHSDRRVAGVSMLLHERLPRTLPELLVRTPTEKTDLAHLVPNPITWPVAVRPGSPRYTLLSNGQYSIHVNSDGGGGSHWQGIGITRWQPDMTTNAMGHWVYVRDLDSGDVFSISVDPSGEASADRQVIMGPHFVEFRCRQQDLLCRMRLGVATQHDVEARKIQISNESDRTRHLIIVSHAELALAPGREFERHPAFARLFVESEYLADEQTLLFRRRPRSAEERPLYVGHMLVPAPDRPVRFGCDADRQRFIGRGNTHHTPAGAKVSGVDELIGRTGATVDPAMSMAMEITLEPYGRTEMALLTGASRSRRELLAALRSFRSLGRVNWLFEQARMQTGMELHHLQLPTDRVRTAMDLLSALLAPHRHWRRVDRRPDQPLQGLLWSRGISGDWPIIVVETGGNAGIENVTETLIAHTFLSGRRIHSDLVLLDPAAGGYEQVTRDRLTELAESIRSRIQRVLTGHVSVIAARELSVEQHQGLLAAASVVLRGDGPPLAEQLRAASTGELPLLFPSRRPAELDDFTPPPEPIRELQFDNGFGGFSADGREYIMDWNPAAPTPAPWSNVLANPDFGCLVTESGASFTWAGNSSEYRLTPWSNDPVQDTPGDVTYIRDEETGHCWSPTPGPRPGAGSYRVHHGIGYSRFVHHGSGLSHDFRMHVDATRPVQICRLELLNHCDWTRRLTVTRFVEWVLGNRRGETALHVDCDLSATRQVLLARNRFDRFAGDRHAFLVSNLPMHGFTTDRFEFLGAGGSVHNPVALHRIGLSGCIESGVDPCGALQVHLDIAPQSSVSVVFVLGHAESREQALELAAEFADIEAAEASFQGIQSEWDSLLGNLQVTTPEPSINLLLNRWLPYQAINARLYGRTGFYQSSGGFGFRDQLQDAMAQVWLRPAITREQILLAASRQFSEGDVLHWWHERPLRGVRTRCSDDLLWLPLVTAFYVRSTGDDDILEEVVPYLEGQPLAAEETERYAEYGHGPRQGTLYEHCCRAIDRASTVGPHGLPVIGNGDWNDGFNRVSTTGRGESVWLGWFMIRVLEDFAACCRIKDDPDCESQYRKFASQLAERIDQSAWDGQWYRRAYCDDGTPIGSSQSDECRIDLIAQTWSVLGPSEPGERASVAMRSALDQLVSYPDRLILLLAPPFDLTPIDPGYIKGYPPGIRENGAQYTHAATWAVWAAARLGWNREAAELFRLLDPIRRAPTPDQARRYRLEPYVLAGDIYSQGDNRGRGGWSWYTGAAAWLYRAGIEAQFGLQIDGDRLIIQPCLPPDWPECSLTLLLRGSEYHIHYVQETGPAAGAGISVSIDGQILTSNHIDLDTKPAAHQVDVHIMLAT
jgi:cyclic beta-1,2-glucan synthetase